AEGVRRLADRALDAAHLTVAGRAVFYWPTERRQGEDRMPRTVQRGPDQLGHPGIDDDQRPAPVSHAEHARDDPAGPGDERAPGLDGEAGRPATFWHSRQQIGHLAGEPLR